MHALHRSSLYVMRVHGVRVAVGNGGLIFIAPPYPHPNPSPVGRGALSACGLTDSLVRQPRPAEVTHQDLALSESPIPNPSPQSTPRFI
ncbi:hypothetical protein XACLG98_320006 [Xanthomonas citri pv. citri]|nr:hypothetical protein XACLG98_320006 [Xanthomonas citri pv. citri]